MKVFPTALVADVAALRRLADERGVGYRWAFAVVAGLALARGDKFVAAIVADVAAYRGVALVGADWGADEEEGRECGETQHTGQK